MLVESCTAPVLSWMLSALYCLPVCSSLYSTRALLTVRLSMSRRIGCGGFSGWAVASATGGLAGAGLPAGRQEAAACRCLPSCRGLLVAGQAQVQAFDTHVAHLHFAAQQRQHAHGQAEHLQIGNGSVGLIRVAMLASCSSRPSHGNRLQPISPLSVSSMWALSRAIWRISSL
jgi:hypothetical protein